VPFSGTSSVRKATLASVLVKTLMDQRTIEPEAA
jgi:hypothetical protein